MNYTYFMLLKLGDFYNCRYKHLIRVKGSSSHWVGPQSRRWKARIPAAGNMVKKGAFEYCYFSRLKFFLGVDRQCEKSDLIFSIIINNKNFWSKFEIASKLGFCFAYKSSLALSQVDISLPTRPSLSTTVDKPSPI